jgi:hypothetical protein
MDIALSMVQTAWTLFVPSWAGRTEASGDVINRTTENEMKFRFLLALIAIEATFSGDISTNLDRRNLWFQVLELFGQLFLGALAIRCLWFGMLLRTASCDRDQVATKAGQQLRAIIGDE